MIAPRSRTPNAPCTCERCGAKGTHGTMLAQQDKPGGRRRHFCPDPCWSLEQRRVANLFQPRRRQWTARYARR